MKNVACESCASLLLFGRRALVGINVLAACWLSACGSSTAPNSVAAGTNPTPACTGSENWPSNTLTATQAGTVDASQFISAGQLKTWNIELDNLGLRATGNPAHETNIDALAARLICAGVQNVHFEDVPLDHYMSSDLWTLNVASGPSAGPVKVAAYVPYSGPTPPQGVTAPLVYLDTNTSATAANAGGKIVLFDVTTSLLPAGLPTPVGAFTAYAMGLYQILARTTDIYSRSYLAIGTVQSRLDQLAAAGATGAIVIHPGSYSTAHGAYFPYDYVQRTVPGLFVDQNVGAQLKALASSSTPMTLTLTGEFKRVTTRNVVGFIPGSSDELTVIHSHTDGTNGIEDNGPNAIVGIAQYVARLPKSSLPRTVMIMLSAGHFTGGSGVQQFLKTHANDGLLQRIASVTTIEHLGAQDWEPDSNGDLQYSGKTELGAMFLPQIQKFADASYDWFINANAGGGAVLKPLNASGDGTADNAVWPGEGQYFYGLAHIPTANYITGPNFLLNWGVTTTDKTDFDRMRREMIAFAQMQLDLSRIPKVDLSTESQAVVTTGSGRYGVGPGP